MKQTASKTRHGISLMEVLASTFVIGVGLLGVLAVIPFGAYQIGKARDAEHCLNMLQSAEADLQIMGLAKPEIWNDGLTINSNGGTTIYNGTTLSVLNHIIMVDPFNAASTGPTGVHIMGANLGLNRNTRPIWQERMRGQDDLDYTRIEGQRPDFSAQNNKVRSSGKYTWFFTFKPTSYNTGDTVDVDIVACYNRVPGAERNVAGTVDTLYAKGARVRMTGTAVEDLDLKNVKQVLVTWDSGVGSCWAKVVNATEYYNNGTNNGKDVILIDNLLVNGLSSLSTGKSVNVMIVDGALYRKTVNGVTIRELP